MSVGPRSHGFGTRHATLSLTSLHGPIHPLLSTMITYLLVLRRYLISLFPTNRKHLSPPMRHARKVKGFSLREAKPTTTPHILWFSHLPQAYIPQAQNPPPRIPFQAGRPSTILSRAGGRAQTEHHHTSWSIRAHGTFSRGSDLGSPSPIPPNTGGKPRLLTVIGDSKETQLPQWASCLRSKRGRGARNPSPLRHRYHQGGHCRQAYHRLIRSLWSH